MMYATPLGHPAIDVTTEVEGLSQALRVPDTPVQLEVSVATADSLTKLLTLARSRSGLVLHLSAHTVQRNGDIGLVLESASGSPHVIWREQLEELLCMSEQGLQNISLLFLSTCHSEPLAQIFVECGCPHVVAIRGKVNDTAATRFSCTGRFMKVERTVRRISKRATR